MKPPGWVVVAPKRQWRLAPDGRTVLVPVRVRLWHPGLWLEVLRTWWRSR